MAGPKTHKRQIHIIEERVNTKNASDDFKAGEDLKCSDAEQELLHGKPKPRGEGGEKDR